MFERLKKFLREVWIELTRVTWPTSSELKGSTGVVIVAVLIATFVIGLVDFMLTNLIGRLLG
jgi:preprotein translocase subunit SecE